MPSARFDPCRRGPDGYPAYVLGWFRKARAGTMNRGYQDVGYLLATGLRRFQPKWLSREAWRYHVKTLGESLARCDDRGVLLWFAVTYPALVNLIPARAREKFVAGVREEMRWGG